MLSAWRGGAMTATPTQGTPSPTEPRPGRPVGLVTGGGTGLGRAISEHLGREGYDLVIASRSQEHLTSGAAKLRETGARVVTVPTDVRNYDQVEALIGDGPARIWPSRRPRQQRRGQLHRAVRTDHPERLARRRRDRSGRNVLLLPGRISAPPGGSRARHRKHRGRVRLDGGAGDGTLGRREGGSPGADPDPGGRVGAAPYSGQRGGAGSRPHGRNRSTAMAIRGSYPADRARDSDAPVRHAGRDCRGRGFPRRAPGFGTSPAR